MPHSKPCPDPFSPESLANLPEARVLLSTVEFVTEYMSNYDGSHDLSHLKRVVSLARSLHFDVPDTTTPPRDPVVVVLAALLHDVGDKKYLKPSDDPSTMVLDFLLSQNVDPATASKVQAICLAVSYSSEVANPAYVQDMLKCYPELAVVQDADRLDAIGAVGIGRCFMFGGAKGRQLQDSVDHFGEKLMKLESMMKTNLGKEMARERTRRLREFVGWWKEETGNF